MFMPGVGKPIRNNQPYQNKHEHSKQQSQDLSQNNISRDFTQDPMKPRGDLYSKYERTTPGSRKRSKGEGGKMMKPSPMT